MRKRHKNLGKVVRLNKTMCMFNTNDIDGSTSIQEKYEKERKIYGFDERETWELNYTSITWLYAHIKRLRDISRLDVDGKYAKRYKVKVITKDESMDTYNYRMKRIFYKNGRYEDKVQFEYTYKVLTVGKIMDKILEYFEYYLKYEDDWDNEITEEIASEGIRLYAKIFTEMWW